MKKRKTMAFLYTIITVACMFAAAVFVFNSDRRFSVKNQPFVATELDYAFCQATKYSADSVMNYVLSNNINTVILPLNNGENSLVEIDGFTNVYRDNSNYEKKDFVKTFKKQFTEQSVQLYVMIVSRSFRRKYTVSCESTWGKICTASSCAQKLWR